MLDPTRPIVFATLDHRAHHGRGFGIRPGDFTRHALVVGRTGAGKSVLLERLLLGQLARGEGVGLLDPHGDLVASVLARMPRFRTNDVLLFDPADRACPVALNPLLAARGQPPALVTAALLAVFERLFAMGWGPRTEHVLRHALLTELERAEPSLLGCHRLLIDDDYRARAVSNVSDPLVRCFWKEEFARWSPALRAEVLASPLNKLGALLTDPTVRALVGQPRNRVECRALMDQGGVLLANLAKGSVGEDASMLLGGLLLALTQLAAYGRADAPPAERRPFTLYVDECQSFATASTGEILAEGRKFGLALVLATQSVAALGDGLRRSVLGNVGTLICFRVGPDDAALLAPLFAPALTALDLTNLAQHQAVVRLSIDGVTSEPFTARTLAPEAPSAARIADIIRRVSRERYGRARKAS